MVQLSCFVACALGKEDVDEIYDKAIEPVVIELGIKACRVDRIEHNDDIDDKIIELIQTCDVCIADLTYARPSVYFEAGYFQGLNKPVVFTVRKDHFRPNEKDVHGIQIIHFDLQMRNIIGWSSTEHVKTFVTRLKSRLRLVTDPILKRKTRDEQAAESARRFRAMPQQGRLVSLSTAIRTRMNQDQWKTVRYSTRIYLYPHNYMLFHKANKIVCIFTTNSATKEYLKYIDSYRIIDQYIDHTLTFNQCHMVIVSLRHIPEFRIEDRYPKIGLLDEQTNTYQGLKEKEVESYYHFISDVQSIPAFSRALDCVMNKITKL